MKSTHNSAKMMPIESTNPACAQQFQSDLQIRLEPIYAKINEINTQFSKDDANRKHKSSKCTAVSE